MVSLILFSSAQSHSVTLAGSNITRRGESFWVWTEVEVTKGRRRRKAEAAAAEEEVTARVTVME